MAVIYKIHLPGFGDGARAAAASTYARQTSSSDLSWVCVIEFGQTRGLSSYLITTVTRTTRQLEGGAEDKGAWVTQRMRDWDWNRTCARQPGAVWGPAWCCRHIRAVQVDDGPWYRIPGMVQNTGPGMDGDVLGDGLLQSIESPGAVLALSRSRSSGEPWECGLLVRLAFGRGLLSSRAPRGNGQGNGLAGRINVLRDACGRAIDAIRRPCLWRLMWPTPQFGNLESDTWQRSQDAEGRAGVGCGITERRCADGECRTPLSTADPTPHSSCSPFPHFRNRRRSSRGLFPVFQKESFLSLPHCCVACFACPACLSQETMRLCSAASAWPGP